MVVAAWRQALVQACRHHDGRARFSVQVVKSMDGARPTAQAPEQFDVSDACPSQWRQVIVARSIGHGLSYVSNAVSGNPHGRVKGEQSCSSVGGEKLVVAERVGETREMRWAGACAEGLVSGTTGQQFCTESTRGGNVGGMEVLLTSQAVGGLALGMAIGQV